MAYVNRPYGNNYYEADREVVREGPYGGSYSSEYRVDEYGNRVLPVGHHNEVVAEVVTDVVPGHRHHHHGGPIEYIERTGERYVDNVYDPYRRTY
ncbi:uncharacterized protein LOC110722566 [Chenopodium quinoa]|uniref:uncharacterized protein LOC110722566 n=1 Tax=Chenopodium quinoa TaxID=63459 RepID=UPI000B778BE5|nr:uncharacterized protein LOC110722566 [Chenopodium quinoa]